MSEDIMFKEKLYCPICVTVILTNEKTRELPTGENGHKECADKVYGKI